jgi:hypothetical protein
MYSDWLIYLHTNLSKALLQGSSTDGGVYASDGVYSYIYDGVGEGRGVKWWVGQVLAWSWVQKILKRGIVAGPTNVPVFGQVLGQTMSSCTSML